MMRRSKDWLQYEVVAVDEAPEFVGVAESPQYFVNECRVAFPAKSINAVHRLAASP